MLVDVVLYSGEKELLDIRLKMLQADITLAIQGTKSFTGHVKPIYPLPKNVMSVVVEDEAARNAWDNEIFVRREGQKKLHELDLPDDAIVGFFDADEIPDPELIRTTSQITAWNMDKYQMSLSWYQHKELTGISSCWAKIKNEDAASIRRNRVSYPQIDGGWHLSSFMTLENQILKWQNISHTELVRANMSEWLEHCWLNGVAVENGNQLTEQSFDNLPSQLKKLPDFLKRTRPQTIADD